MEAQVRCAFPLEKLFAPDQLAIVSVPYLEPIRLVRQIRIDFALCDYTFEIIVAREPE
jgi:hypothetical protein